MRSETTPAPQAGAVTFFLLALAAGLGAANLYYAQPLVALIADDIGLDETLASLVVTVSQTGYILGLLLLVPLGDIVENRRLIALILICASAGLALASIAPTPALFLAAALMFGIGSVVAQIAVPFAAHLARPEERGRKVGSVVSGLMTGILLARPVASIVAHFFGWRAVFALAALMILVLAVGLRLALPTRRPAATGGGGAYGALVASLWPLMRSQPVLRRRAAYQAVMFGVFILFWTAVPLQLAAPAFGFGQEGIALFALAGAASVVVSPLAGWIADKGYSRAATGGALLLAGIGLLLTQIGVGVGSVVVLAVGAIVLDCAATANLVFGQRALFMLAPEIRSRLNALYIATFFFGGVLGSAVASPLYQLGGWSHVTIAGIAAVLLALAYYASEFRRG
ncbi:putative MFS family arabinose efflux permease [Angulomicrobium tetraedrale]|uniref:Putative MFS family arabinose efflux permease n=1 Tax=Ancylobacter tetraedralis TaxID=217068 RepID=A0A839Z7W0_9HYPH|nr:MFS transporter [Ancylobacter tetraedralis]MBB3770318.1 putative MFS family arabinose efflux permease [Ancylobacter tetraedralis]